MLFPEIPEIAKRLVDRSTIRFSRLDATYEFSRIHASQTRDYDGTPANWSATDSRNPIQLKTVRNNGRVTYTNYW